jgi:cystathionine beta-lyase/cystathionine gamma-synthase
MGGLVISRDEMDRAALVSVMKLVGGVLGVWEAHEILRGLKTLAVRVERQNATALAVARWLSTDRRIAAVYYPGLEQHPDHDIATKQMRGFGGMVCVDVGGGYDRAARFFDRLEIFRRAASLGGVESLCSLPVLTSQWGHSEEELERAGITHSMARLSIGLEDPADLIADLDQALGSA